MKTGRRVCLAIGISDAGGGLDYLGGAVTGATEIHAWAQAMGYESTLLVDEPSRRIDVDCVKTALMALLPMGSATERLILYFAGHGLVSAADNGLWLPTGWRKDKRAIAAEVLRRRLREFGVEQITIIADACRKLPQSIDFADLTQDGVLGEGFVTPLADPLIDRFTATQDGLAAYMIPGTAPDEPDRCLFSGVLLEGLWGQHEAAFSRRVNGKVISQSLADYLRRRVPEIAGRYGLRMDPQAIPGFPETADVYFDRMNAPRSPVLPPWPDHPSVPLVELALERARDEGGGDSGVIRAGMHALGEQVPKGRWGSPPGVVGFSSRLGNSPGAPKAMEERRWRKLTARIRSEGSRSHDANSVQWLVERVRDQLATNERDRRERAREVQTLNLIRSVPARAGATGLTVGGGNVARVWAPPEAALKRIDESNWGFRDHHWSASGWQALVEFEEGAFGCCVVMPQLLTRLAWMPGEGVRALVMQPDDGGQEVARSLETAEQAIARLASRRLEQSAVTDLATDLRMMKHANPVLGVISAYLYDAIGDQESIRRMAYFYVYNGQAIPFDIAFLGDLLPREGFKDPRQRFVTVPAISERKPGTSREGQEWWTTCATPKVRGEIAGFVPWMRRGWPFIAGTAAEGALALLVGEGLPEPLMAGTFTTLTSGSGRTLVDLLQLEEAS